MRETFFIHIFRKLRILWAIVLPTVAGTAGGFMERYGIQPVIHYRLKLETGDISGYKIEMHLRHVPHHFRLAMATHHEYDDRFWRFVRNFQVEIAGGKAFVRKTDSAVWDITVPGSDAVVSYDIQLPGRRFAHQPFLSPYGGLLGDIHSFFYLVGWTQIPATVTFELPEGWQMVTGLERTTESNTFIAPSTKILMDCPVLAGYLHKWTFTVKGIPYTVAYLPIADTPAFDKALLVANLQKIVIQTVRLFGSAPYKHYAFLLEDGIGGALEHVNSVTIGAPATLLATHMQDNIYEEIAHEFFHTWNLMSIRPAGYTDLNYGPQERSAGLWFSEGLAMFYADLLLRRAGLPCEDSTRTAHLESLISRYYADTGNMVLSPAAVSLAANGAPGMLGDYSASVHLQGELIGAMLDLLIRDATRGTRSFDDVMRVMYRRFGEKDGFYARDIERTVKDVCGSEMVHPFFQRCIYEGKALNFEPFLRLIGLRVQLSYHPAVDDKGCLVADRRLYIWQPTGDTVCHLVMTDPRSCWVRAGLHTGDILLTINGQRIQNRQNFNDWVKTLRIGDRIIVQVDHHGSSQKIPVDITGYDIPVAHLLNTGNKNIEMQKIFQQWQRGQ